MFQFRDLQMLLEWRGIVEPVHHARHWVIECKGLPRPLAAAEAANAGIKVP